MNRYQIALGFINKPIAYRFNSTTSIKRIFDCMKRCFDDGVMFDMSNMDVSLVNAALAKFSKEIKIPIVVKENKESISLSIAHEPVQVYSLEKLKELEHLQKLLKIKYVICYLGVKERDLPKNTKSVLKIIQGDE